MHNLVHAEDQLCCLVLAADLPTVDQDCHEIYGVIERQDRSYCEDQQYDYAGTIFTSVDRVTRFDLRLLKLEETYLEGGNRDQYKYREKFCFHVLRIVSELVADHQHDFVRLLLPFLRNWCCYF